jgi:hypothetical protein
MVARKADYDMVKIAEKKTMPENSLLNIGHSLL